MARSRQNANQVPTIEGTAIGGTTPAAGAFTTLGATGAVTLAGTTALNGPINVNGAASVAGQIIRSAGPSVPAAWGAPLVLGTAQASTSGTAIDFTGIPSWVKRVTVMFNGVSLSGLSDIVLQLGAGSILTTGYVSSAMAARGAATSAGQTLTTGLVLTADSGAATYAYSGSYEVKNITGNSWVGSGLLAEGTGVRSNLATGSVSLSGVLDRIRVTSRNGTDVFDAGSINIMWE